MDEIMENITEENPEVKYKFVEPTDPNIAGLKKLQKVITELKVPKSGFNKFGGFSYRTLDDIIDGLRPLCIKYGIVYVIRDNVIFLMFVLYPNGVQPENIDYVFNNFTAAITEYNRRTQRT